MPSLVLTLLQVEHQCGGNRDPWGPRVNPNVHCPDPLSLDVSPGEPLGAPGAVLSLGPSTAPSGLPLGTHRA